MDNLISGEDPLVFAEERETSIDNTQPWKVLVVDDDEDIHAVTTMLLRDFRFDGRGLALLHAYSGAEGRSMAEANPDIALAFIDVVMETDDAGLVLVKQIRDELENKLASIILRTGQPGMAPETAIIRDYGINDYREKTELTATRMYTVTYSALKSHQALFQLSQTNLTLTRLVSSLEEFSYMVTHDLKAPLQHISTLAEFLHEDFTEELGDDGAEKIERMRAACRQATSLVVGLLELAQVEKTPAVMAMDDANKALDNALVNLTSTIENENATVSKTELPPVYCNAVFLSQIFQNLIANAAKFHKPDKSVHIMINSQSFSDRVRFSVADNGIGIPVESQQAIFNAFSKVHRKFKIEGYGIGLAICKKIIDVHQGLIWAENNADGGTTFFFEIPVAARTQKLEQIDQLDAS